MNRRLRVLSGALLLALSAAPARADFQQFLDATCGRGCADPIGEQAAARENWGALQSMGTTSWIGSTLGGTKIDASSLLGAARVGGASELDRWLTTGDASSTEVAQAMSDALRGDAGLDVTLITGQLSAVDPSRLGGQDGYSDPSTLPSFSLTGALAGAFGGVGGGSGNGYCAQDIDQSQNANAQRYVNAMQQIATSGDYGFSQNGGQPVSSGAQSGSGYFKGGCLEQLMTGARDLLFRPPGLSGLLGQLGGMFGGGGGGGANGCAAAPSVMSQITKSMPQAIFQPGNGGFLPATAFGGSGLMAGSGLSSLGRASMGATPSISALLGR